MGAGSTIGSIAGAALGTAIAPGIGTQMGGMIGGGIGQSIEGGMKSKKSDEGIASEADINRLRAFEEARRMQRQLETGSDALTQANIRENEQLTAGTQRAIGQSTGGNVNATIAGMLSAQKQGGLNTANTLGVAAQRGQYFSSLADSIGSQIAQRKMDLQNLKSARLSAQGAQLQKQGFMNTFAGLAQTDPKALTDMIAKFNLGNGQTTGNAGATTGQETPVVNTETSSSTPVNEDGTPALNTVVVPQSILGFDKFNF